MITLHGSGPRFGLPDASPFVVKAQVLLKMSGLPHQVVIGDFRKAPKGKIPWLVDDGTIIPDTTFIRWHLEQQHGCDFDPGLTASDRGIAWAFEKLCEEHLYWAAVAERWLIDANFDKGPRTFFDRVPGLMRPLVVKLVRKKVVKALDGQGFGRHRREEILQLADRTLQSIADFMADKPYLMGSQPCGADATVFAMLWGTACPHFDSPLIHAVNQRANLGSYVARMRQQYFPG